MFLYHWQHPFQYIALACLVFSVLATALTLRIARLADRSRPAAILGLLLGSVLLASAPGGALWSIHDMQAGYFPAGARFWGALAWGASTGLQTGWLIIALSFPLQRARPGRGLLHHDLRVATLNGTFPARRLTTRYSEPLHRVTAPAGAIPSQHPPLHPRPRPRAGAAPLLRGR